ncbi:MAG TPA: metallophosphoesterase family protein [Thermoanaerobaculia bacterium]|nr:metallophosphoesterase family protein [Thermoanaerobaculia bacterium]
MHYLILSDMHGNIDALDAVLRRVRRKRFDATLVLGDLVGYGAGANKVVEKIRQDLPGEVWRIRGNHDKVVAGIESGENFNHAALAAARWTAEHLSPTNLRFVRDLPAGPIDLPEGPTICHGSPLDEDQYVFSIFEAWEIFTHYPMGLTFFGHTHVPCVFVEQTREPAPQAAREGQRAGKEVHVALLPGPGGSLRLEEGKRYLINPGSVGQPRDRDPRASYMTYDSSAKVVRWYRLSYPVEKAQERIRKAGLPSILAERLALGA